MVAFVDAIYRLMGKTLSGDESPEQCVETMFAQMDKVSFLPPTHTHTHTHTLTPLPPLCPFLSVESHGVLLLSIAFYLFLLSFDPSLAVDSMPAYENN